MPCMTPHVVRFFRKRRSCQLRGRSRRRGFTLIEALAALLIFGFLVSVFYRIFIASSAYMVNSRMLRGAVTAANERMEQYRNMAYDDIGTTDGAPLGMIVPDETVAIEGMRYRIITSVFFVDDPHDEIAPDDMLFEDYKRVSVTIAWREAADASVPADRVVHDADFASRRITLVSQFIPPGGRETSVSGGILHVNVLNGDGQPISNMPVEMHDIENDRTVTMRTDTVGRVQYVGAMPCEGCYAVTVGRNGYQTVYTEPLQEAYTPKYVHQSVIKGDLTALTVLSEPVADITFACMDGSGAPLPQRISLSMVGGRIRGLDVEGNVIFFDHDDLLTDAHGVAVMRTDTNGDGVITTDDHADPGTYTVTIPTELDGYQLWKVGDQLPDIPEIGMLSKASVSIMPGEERTIPIFFVSQEHDAVLVTVVDADGPIDGASVRIQGEHEGLSFDVEGVTDATGTAYLIPEDTAAFLPDTTYELTVEADGYQKKVQDVTVSALTHVSVTLEKT